MAAFDFSKLLTAGGTAATSAVSPWTLAAAAPAELFKLGKGIADRSLANKLDRSSRRPGFEIPAAAIEALGTQRNLAMGRAPGQAAAENLMLQSQAGNTNAILNSGGGAGERMAALLGQNQFANQSALQLAANQENWTASQNQNLIGQLNRFEDWQQKKWMWDKQQPYEQAKQKAAELRGDASQNIYGALRGIGGQAASVIGYDNDGGSIENGTSRLSGAAGSAIGTRQAESPADSIRTQNQRIDRSNMGPQGEGPGTDMDYLSAKNKDAVISDPDGLMQDPEKLINRNGESAKSDVPKLDYRQSLSTTGVMDNPLDNTEMGVSKKISPVSSSALKPLVGRIGNAISSKFARNFNPRAGLPQNPFRGVATPTSGPVGPEKPITPPVAEMDVDRRILEGEANQNAYNNAQNPMSPPPTPKAMDSAGKPVQFRKGTLQGVDLQNLIAKRGKPSLEVGKQEASPLTATPKVDTEYSDLLKGKTRVSPEITPYENQMTTKPKADTNDYSKLLNPEKRDAPKLDYAKEERVRKEREIREKDKGKTVAPKADMNDYSNLLNPKARENTKILPNAPSDHWLNQKTRSFSDPNEKEVFYTKGLQTADLPNEAAYHEFMDKATTERVPQGVNDARILDEIKAHIAPTLEKNKSVPFVKELLESHDGSAFAKYPAIGDGEKLYLYEILKNGQPVGVAVGPKHPKHEDGSSSSSLSGIGGVGSDQRESLGSSYVIFDAPRERDNEVAAEDFRKEIWNLASLKRDEMKRQKK